MYSDAMCRLAARVIIVELGARVILTRSGICAAHTGVPKKSANGFFCRHSCRTGAAAVRFFMKSVPGGIRFGSVPYLPVSIVSYII